MKSTPMPTDARGAINARATGGGAHPAVPEASSIISQAVRRPGHYVTKKFWESGDLSLAGHAVKDMWLSYLMVSISPSITPTGTLVLRFWDSTYAVAGGNGADLDPTDQYLLFEQSVGVGDVYFWEPPVMLMEEAMMRYPDGRIVRTQYYLRYFLQYGFRLQLLDFDANENTYTVVEDSMHVIAHWFV